MRRNKDERSTLDRPLVAAVAESEMPPKAEGPRDAEETAGGSPFRTALNIANTLEGMGLLGLPYTVRLAGAYAGGAVLLVCIISAYTAVVISSSLYAAQRATPRWSGDVDYFGVTWIRERSSYVANARSAFGVSGGVAVMVMQLFTLISVTAIFLVLVGDSLAGVMPQIVSSETLARLPLSGDKLWVVLAWICVVPTAWMSSMWQVSWLSGAGVALLLGIIGVLVYAAIAALEGALPNGDASLSSSSAVSHTWRNRMSELPTGDDARHAIPCAFAMLLFSFSCHAMIPGFEQGMRPSQRQHFPLVVVTTFGGCAVLKASFMTAAWLAFGANTPQVATTALQPFALDAAVTIAVAVNTVLTIPTFLFIIQHILSDVWPLPEEQTAGAAGRKNSRALHVHARRLCLLFAVLAPALAVPELPAMMVWVGSLASPFMVFILPLSFHLKLRWGEVRSGLYSRARFCLLCVGHSVVLAIGMTGAVLGIWMSLHPGDCMADDEF